VVDFARGEQRSICAYQAVIFRAYLPRLWAIFRAYLPRPEFLQNPFAPICPALSRLSRLFAPPFWDTFRTFAPICPDLDPLEIQAKADFRAYLPRPRDGLSSPGFRRLFRQRIRQKDTVSKWR